MFIIELISDLLGLGFIGLLLLVELLPLFAILLLVLIGIAVALYFVVKRLRSLSIVLLALMLSGCSTGLLTQTKTVGTIIENDLAAFQANAEQYGTEGDLACANLLKANFDAINELIKDDSGALLAFTYRSVLAHRMALGVEQLLAQHCGGFLVEIATALARFRR